MRIQWVLPTTRIHRFTKVSRSIDVEVTTSLGHAVVGVEATIRFNDGTTLRAHTNDEGLARFTGAPTGIDGTVTYEDESDLIARSFAANMNAALESEDDVLMIQFLQSAVDFGAVKSAFTDTYDGDLSARIEETFAQGEHGCVFHYLLAVVGLVTDGPMQVMPRSSQ